MDSKPLVSIRMLAYNHEAYIAQAIESVLMQETSFDFELVIADDASTDKSQTIIKKYVNEHPDIIKAVLRQNNLGAAENSYQIRSMCTGKYVTALEGDDYWTDKKKLQMQVDFLEENKNCKSVAHRHEIVDEQGRYLGVSLESMQKDRFFGKKDALQYGPSLLHVNSIMHYNFFHENEEINAYFKRANKYGIHSLLIYYLASLSDIFVFAKPMSVWRKVVKEKADNFTSFAVKNPLALAENDFDKYINYKSLFGKEYNFSPLIRRHLIIYASRLVRSDNKKGSKRKLFNEKCKKLAFKDLILLPFTCISILLQNLHKKLRTSNGARE